jgi:hypothetical protein
MSILTATVALAVVAMTKRPKSPATAIDAAVRKNPIRLRMFTSPQQSQPG